MKRRELLQQIDQLARQNNVEWSFHREGGNHEIWRFNGKKIPIPRDKEFGNTMARQILKECKNSL